MKPIIQWWDFRLLLSVKRPRNVSHYADKAASSYSNHLNLVAKGQCTRNEIPLLQPRTLSSGARLKESMLPVSEDRCVSVLYQLINQPMIEVKTASFALKAVMTFEARDAVTGSGPNGVDNDFRMSALCYRRMKAISGLTDLIPLQWRSKPL